MARAHEIIALVALVIGCRRETAAVVVDASPDVEAPKSSPWAWVHVEHGFAIRTGTVIDVPDKNGEHPFQSSAMHLAIFPGDDPKADAVEIVDSPGQLERTWAEGHWQICAVGDSRDKQNKTRSAWNHGCKRFDVAKDGVVKMTGGSGPFGHVVFSCETETAGVCTSLK